MEVIQPRGVGVVGCGKIGAIRAAVAAADPRSRLIAVADVVADRAADIANREGVACSPSWQSLIDRDDIEAVVVATTHDQLAPVSLAALRAGKHVLCEKPMSTNVAEAAGLLEATRHAGRVLKVGFNHRYHPAILRARQAVDEGQLGPLLFIRCRYGHGGRPGYEHEWRMDPARSGGGELLDQGIHAIDLFRWFLGELSEVTGLTATWVWPTTVEDNAFAFFRTPAGQVASLHASWTQWKNLFSFEIFGERGAAIVTGLGGSYGTEELSVYHRADLGGAPREEHFEFPGPDGSWTAEWADFMSAIEGGPSRSADAADGAAALALVEAVYESARRPAFVRVDESRFRAASL